MATKYLLIAASCLSSFLAVFFFASYAGNNARIHRVQRRAGSHGFSRILQEGIPGCIWVALRVYRLPVVVSYMQQLCSVLRERGIEAHPLATLSVLLGTSAVVIVIATITSRFLLGLLMLISLVLLLGAWASRSIEARSENIRATLPDALQAMSSCFGAGFTLLQTFEHLERETSGPLGALFGHAAKAMQAGDSPTQALALVRKEAKVTELSFVAVALAVQYQTGGSMQRVLDATRDSLKEELELRQSLRVHTAQAKLSARVVVGVTIGIVAAMMLLSKDFLEPFFESSLGVALLFLAVIMQGAGIMLVRRLLNVEVSA